jgi:hypothetical protein
LAPGFELAAQSGSAGRNKDALQCLFADQLLQHRNAGEPSIDTVRPVTGTIAVELGA